LETAADGRAMSQTTAALEQILGATCRQAGQLALAKPAADGCRDTDKHADRRLSSQQRTHHSRHARLNTSRCLFMVNLYRRDNSHITRIHATARKLSKFRAYLASFSRYDAGQTDAATENRRPLHCKTCEPNKQPRVSLHRQC